MQVSLEVLALLSPDDLKHIQAISRSVVLLKNDLFYATQSLQSVTVHAINKLFLEKRFVLFGNIIFQNEIIFTACIVYFESLNCAYFSAIKETDMEKDLAGLN